MCGIAGLLDLERRSGSQELEALGRAMAATLNHRGPDAHGVWSDAEAGVALGHTRLSIVDLSPAGAQPMVSSCGACVITYNGEIYNAADLRPELEARGRRFRGHSDTEVLVEAIAEWGVKPTVERLIGMFAFALWDRRDRTLSLVRDRLGIKPLYFGRQNGRVVFASELKAFEVLPDWRPELNRDALAAYLRLAYVPSPHSIYRGIDKLAPGHIATIDAEGKIETSAFWSVEKAAERGKSAPFNVSDREAIDTLEMLLGDAVGRRLVADVPLGAFLSGGIDSSAVAAMMRMRSNAPVRTYSIGFREEGFDEAPHARAVASHLGTEHTELYVSPAEAREVIPDLPTIYDEPFADSSQIPTYLLSKLTREHVTVALSGDGGDELFAGYTRHRFARLASGMPAPMGRALACGLGVAGPALWERVFSLLPAERRPKLAADKMHKAARLFRAGEEGGYLSLVSAWDDPDAAREWRQVSRRVRSSMPASHARCQTRSTACNISTPSPISPTTSSPRSIAPAWRLRSKCACRSSIIASWNFPGGCLPASRCGAARASGCCARCSTATCRRRWWSGQSRASPYRLGNGSGDRCAPGPRSCCRRSASARAGCSIRRRSGRDGSSIWRARATGMLRCGQC